jgi:hypothetical protein
MKSMKFQMCGEKFIRLLPHVNVWTCEPYMVVRDERSLIEYTVFRTYLKRGLPNLI